MPRQDSGVPIQQRRFPWRLWLFAILMTGAAGAGGYFTWQYRAQSIKAKDDLGLCTKNLGSLQASAGDSTKQLKTCTDSLGATTLKATELEKQNNEFSKWVAGAQETAGGLSQTKIGIQRLDEASRELAVLV